MKLTECRRCPRLVAWREEAGRNPPRRFAGERYWSRPVPAFGERGAGLLLVGLAPAAHGGNRTGRMFTGDESGAFLFRALHAVGLASQPTSIRRGDGLALGGALLTAVCRCAPPDNRPRPDEIASCRGYLEADFRAMARPRVLVALGALAFGACVDLLGVESRAAAKTPRPLFSHGARYRFGEDWLLASYHPSQQNTFTGLLTQGMLRGVLRKAKTLIGAPDYFLKSASKAERASSGVAVPRLPVRSKVFAGA